MQQTRGVVVAVTLVTLLTGVPTAQASDPVRSAVDAQVAFNPGGGDVHCGDTLTQHTKLTHDLDCPATAPFALRVAGDGIVLDLGGHTVRRTGPEPLSSRGILVEANSMVRNGTVRGFFIGIVSQPGTGQLRLHKLALLGNGFAVVNRSSTRFLITECFVSGNGTGLTGEVEMSSGSFDVRASVFTHNEHAAFLYYHSLDVLDSIFTSNGDVFNCVDGNVRFRSSTLAWNTAVGGSQADLVGPLFCSELRFENTLIANNAALATTLEWQPLKLSMINSWVVSNGTGLQAAIETVYIDGNTFFDNAGGLTLSDRPAYVPYPLIGIVRGNQFLSNDGDGLRVPEPNTPTLIRNVALHNTGFGIYAPTAFDGGGNVARDNGAGNCVGIHCAPY
ncbi:right-handed parallel beta-helix repeat-containing protein [Corallococcus sp. AB011P]|uniref:right-handed parallel beta-helix repeat-containing protein n=1 Tax=Corallococcus sp. AB011P TaxID=2316735 RepID=UPI000EA0687B|nr:right-handed parallel beta-helix repeat-containing protein [Corallococcus sp. AB011P]RKG62575.1 right-handed parallel beta-helix repeat-containing protein [Corallococcus sp. AB011P]